MICLSRRTAYVILTIIMCSFASLAIRAQPATAPTTAPGGDVGTDLVASFYKTLLQEKPPTRQQELALFEPLSRLRWVLVMGKNDGLPTIEPMERTAAYFEQRRRVEEKVAAAGPVALNYFRKHKEWFLPKNMNPPDVQISSTYRFVRNLTRMKDPPSSGDGSVLVLFTDDKNAPPGAARFRSLIFRITNGRIEPDAIWLDGYQGRTTGELSDQELR